jgi:hypothetical protein
VVLIFEGIDTEFVRGGKREREEEEKEGIWLLIPNQRCVWSTCHHIM